MSPARAAPLSKPAALLRPPANSMLDLYLVLTDWLLLFATCALLAAVCKAADLPAAPANSAWPAGGCDNSLAGSSCTGSCAAGYSGSVSVTCNSNAGGAPTWGTPSGTCVQRKPYVCTGYIQLHWGVQDLLIGPVGLLHDVNSVPMFTPSLESTRGLWCGQLPGDAMDPPPVALSSVSDCRVWQAACRPCTVGQYVPCCSVWLSACHADSVSVCVLSSERRCLVAPACGQHNATHHWCAHDVHTPCTVPSIAHSLTATPIRPTTSPS